MGLFGKAKKTKNAKWVCNRKPTLVTLHDDHIHFENAAKENDVFYVDIKNIEKKAYTIEIKTAVEKFKLTPRKIRGAGDLSEELYTQIREKMSLMK